MSEIEKRKLCDLRVVDLRSELEKRGLDKTGVKAVLIERLQKVLKEENEDPETYLFDIIEKKTPKKSKKAGDDNESETQSNTDELHDPIEEEEMKEDNSKENSEDNQEKQNSPKPNDPNFLIKKSEIAVTSSSDDSKENPVSINEEKEVINKESEEMIVDTETKTTNESDTESKDQDNQKDELQPQNSDIINKEENEEIISKNEIKSEMISSTSQLERERNLPESNGLDNEDSINLTIEEDEEKLLVEEDDSQEKGHKDEREEAGQGEGVSEKADSQQLSNRQSESSISKASTKQNKSEDLAASNQGQDTSTVESKEEFSSPSGNKSETIGSEHKSSKDDKDKKKSIPQQNTSSNSSRNLWISCLSSSTRATDLKQVFSKYGKVIGAKVVTNAKTPGARCYGYITMATHEDASKCIQYLHRTELHGRMISVERARGDSTGPPKKIDNKSKKIEEKKKPDKKFSETKSDDNLEAKEKEKLQENTSKIETHSENASSLKNDLSEKRDRERRKSRESGSGRSSREISKDRHRSAGSIGFSSRHSSRSPHRSSYNRKSVLTFSQIREERERERLREVARELRDQERRRREEMTRQLEIEKRHREEADRLEREKARLRIEREKIEKERAELMRLERDRQRLEREKLEMEREELKRQQMRFEEQRRQSSKRPQPSEERREKYVEERSSKRIATERGRGNFETPPNPPSRYEDSAHYTQHVEPTKMHISRIETWSKPIDQEDPRESFVVKNQQGNKRSTSSEYARRDNTNVFDDSRGNSRRGEISPGVGSRRGNPSSDPARSKEMSRIETWSKPIDQEDPRESFGVKNQQGNKRSTSSEYARRDNTNVFDDSRGNSRRGEISPGVGARRGNPSSDPARSKEMSSRFERPNNFNRMRRPESDHRKVDIRHSTHSSIERYGDNGKGDNRYGERSGDWHSGNVGNSGNCNSGMSSSRDSWTNERKSDLNQGWNRNIDSNSDRWMGSGTGGMSGLGGRSSGMGGGGSGMYGSSNNTNMSGPSNLSGMGKKNTYYFHL